MNVAVELDANPDAVLIGKDNVISADGPVIQKSKSWFNLNGWFIREKMHQAWVFDFNDTQDAAEAKQLHTDR